MIALLLIALCVLTGCAEDKQERFARQHWSYVQSPDGIPCILYREAGLSGISCDFTQKGTK
jgi:hypothetical protein